MSGTGLGTDAFTYFPLLGYPSMAPTVSTTYTGLYGSMPIPSHPHLSAWLQFHLSAGLHLPPVVPAVTRHRHDFGVYTPYTPYSPMRLNPTGARPPVVGLHPPAGRPIAPPPPPRPAIHVGGH